jgi:hypothetical protein
MELRYLRTEIFQSLLRPVSTRARRRRMEAFTRIMKVRGGVTVLDLGGHPAIWRGVSCPLKVTILNLPGNVSRSEVSHHTFTYVEGDACDVRGVDDFSFDIVFSNSVIEHVGPAVKQDDFAREVRRLGRSYWVQTPSNLFPLEAHTGMPFWWLYPDGLRQYFLRGWKRKLPAWTEFIEGTRVLSKKRMRELFPEAQVLVERYFGIPKSYVAWFSASQPVARAMVAASLAQAQEATSVNAAHEESV